MRQLRLISLVEALASASPSACSSGSIARAELHAGMTFIGVLILRSFVLRRLLVAMGGRE
jgi:hypothetical protein